MKNKQLKTNVQSLQGKITVPGDKSISHRAIMFGSIAEGKTTIDNFLAGEDCLSTISCFRKLGVNIELNGTKVKIEGVGLNGLQEAKEILDVGNSGTTLRLISGILAGRPFYSSLVGDASIAKRPMTRVVNPLRQMGAKIDGREDGKYTPISIRGGDLTGITYELPVASAQVKSSILLAGLQANGKTVVIEPEKTRNHTETMLQMFGVDVECDERTITIEGGQTLSGTHVTVPGDISSAAFFLVAGAIVSNSRILLKNVGLNETRSGIIDVLKRMGAEMQITRDLSSNVAEPYGDIEISASALNGTSINGSIIPRLIDEIPVIALLATQAEGTTIISDAKELKVKETNRIDTVVSELSKLGANITATEDGMIIHGPTPLHGGTVNSHGDHRIGMMLAVAACVANGDVTLEDAEAVAVSYPNFFEHLEQLMQ
ncbi:MAG: 3-phosphoshikimate 1-carboxyvinyltransferase [Bacillus sp. (in: firmicutes)]